MAFSAYLQEKWLKHVFKVATYTPASQLKLALGTSAPGPTDITSWSGEVSGGSYARQNIGFSPALGRDRELAEIRNDAAIDFPQATANWGNIGWWAIFEDAVTPYLLAFGEFCETIAVNTNDQYPVAGQALALAVAESHYPLSMQRALLDHTFAGDAWTAPSNIYLAASTTEYRPGMEAADLEEPSGGNYSRLQHNSWSVASAAASNSGNASFATASANWADPVRTLAIFTAATGGQLIAAVGLQSALSIFNGDVLRANSGTIVARVEATEEAGPGGEG